MAGSPLCRLFNTGILADIYRIAYREGAHGDEKKGCLGNDAEYPLCLGYGAFAIRDVVAAIDASLILGDSDSLGVAVGFDSGDFVLLGELTDEGLQPFDPDFESPPPLIEPTLERLRSNDGGKVLLAVYDLQRFGDQAKLAVPDLLGFASASDDSSLRSAAVNTLAAIAADDPRAKAIVLGCLNDTEPDVRRQALQALIQFDKIERLSSIELARIKDMENDPDSTVARWSEVALRNIRLKDKDS